MAATRSSRESMEQRKEGMERMLHVSDWRLGRLIDGMLQSYPAHAKVIQDRRRDSITLNVAAMYEVLMDELDRRSVLDKPLTCPNMPP